MNFNVIQNEISKEDASLIESIIKEIEGESISCAVIFDSQIIFRDKGRGVSCLLKFFRDENRPKKDVIIIDKIVGKAAAMLADLMGARAVYGGIMSESGKKYLDERSILAFYDSLVERIMNRSGDDYCPIEKSVLSVANPQEGLKNILATIEILMKNK